MLESFEIRRAGAREADSIARHRRLMFDEMGLASGSELDRLELDAATAIAAAMADGYYHHWFARREGDIAAGAGVILARWLPMPGEPTRVRATVLNVYTERDCRHQGLARRLVAIVTDWCRDQGLASVQLHASDAGRRLYQSLGFEQTNEMRLTLKGASLSIALLED